MTSPSSGVKPIVVSTDRPSRTAASDAPAPRWQVTIRSSSTRPARASPPPGARRRRATARGSRTCGAPSACATRAGGRRSSRRPASPAWKAVSKQATAGTSGSDRRHRRERGERLRLVERREVGRAPAGRASTSASRRTGPAVARPAVDDPVADRVDRRRSRAIGLGDRAGVGRRRGAPAGRPIATTASAASRTRSLRLLDPALTTRIRLPASDRAASPAAASLRPRPVRDLGRVLALEPRVGPALEPPVDHQLAHVRRPARPSPGTRSMTSITRWNRSRSLSMTMSNGVVVVPSSL